MGPCRRNPKGASDLRHHAVLGRLPDGQTSRSPARLAWHHLLRLQAVTASPVEANSLARDPRDFCHGLLARFFAVLS
jgi:hypothetical protein